MSNIYYYWRLTAQGYTCCEAHQGRLTCPLEKPIMCATQCGGSQSHCCAVTQAQCANTGPALSLDVCPTLVSTATTAATTKSTTKTTTTGAKTTTTKAGQTTTTTKAGVSTTAA